MFRSLVISMGALLLFATAKLAQPAEITEAEFLARVEDDHPAAIVLQDHLVDAVGELRASRAENLTVAIEREAPDGAAAQTTAVLSWRPPLDGRRGLGKKAAEAGMEAARQSLAWERLQLRAHLRELFAEWNLVVERRDLFQGLSSRTGRLASRARTRAASGEESGLSARRLELAFVDAAGELAVAEAELTRLVTRLRALVPDLDPGLDPVRPSLPEMSGSLDAQHRPDVLASEHELERAELEHRLASRFLEFPALVAGWTYLDEDDADLDGPVFGVEWTIPLFDRNQGARARAKLEARVARSRLELARASAEAELQGASKAYRGLRTAATSALESTADLESVVQSATAEFQAGESTLTDLLDTFRAATESRLAAIELYHDALAAHRTLELNRARPSTEDGGAQ